MHDWIDVGVFGAREPGKMRKPLYLKKHLITQPGKQTITVTVQEKPDGAGIDPYYLLIDTEPHDNAKRAKIQE
jgi:ABC-2 type transport system permease protein